jgi:plastocyanin
VVSQSIDGTSEAGLSVLEMTERKGTMEKKLMVSIAFLTILVMFTVLLAACSIHGATTATGPTVHMGNANFLQNSITIQKGQSIALIDDVAVEHIITNGTWKNGQQEKLKEPNAPSYNHPFTGNDNDSPGPFNVSGTFQSYCTIHPGMNLMVIAQ